jgi:hypothetical protein
MKLANRDGSLNSHKKTTVKKLDCIIFANRFLGKPTGSKRRWCVLADQFLYYFSDNKVKKIESRRLKKLIFALGLF